jgi:hypothetical protein
MKKVISVVLFVVVLVGALVSCGSSKHAGKCDAYSLNKKTVSNQDLANK